MIKLLKYSIFIILSILFKNRKKSENLKDSHLFVNTGQIGDLIISSLILENDKLLNNDKYYLLINEEYKDLFSKYRGKVKILTFNILKYRYILFYRIKILRKLHKLRFYSTYNITAARGFINDEITLLSGADRCYATTSSDKYLGQYFLNKFNSKYEELILNDIKNEYRKTSNLICTLTGVSENDINFNNKITFSIKNKLESKGSFITLAPYASTGTKEWGESNYKYLIEKLSKNNKIFLLGTKKQKKKLSKLKQNLKNVELITRSLKEVIEIINESRLFIGNDSGLTHIAYRLGIPVIAILGGGGYEKFIPFIKLNNKSYVFFYKLDCFGCDWDCIYNEPYCITKVKKEVVLDKILNILKF